MNIKWTLDMKTLGVVELSFDSIEEFVKTAALFQGFAACSPCPMCQAAVIFRARKTRKGLYYELACTGRPSHTAQIHQHKQEAGGGFYFKGPQSFDLSYQDRNGGPPDEERGDAWEPEFADAPPAKGALKKNADAADAPTPAAMRMPEKPAGFSPAQWTMLTTLSQTKEQGLEVLALEMFRGKPFPELNGGEAARMIAALKKI